MYQYETTHPWITFTFDLGTLNGTSWRLLGEAEASCDSLAGSPLDPAVAATLNSVSLAKGTFATTSIEGNTLTEEEVFRRLHGELELPPSRDYLGIEVDNVVAAYNGIIRDLGTAQGHAIPFTTQRLAVYNQTILQNLEAHLEEGVTPGEYREGSVAVGNYLAPPRQDVEHLTEALCDWLNAGFSPTDLADEFAYAAAVVKAILAHVYLVWVHPYGDGNGRTARLMEFQILLEHGLPLPAAHLLSDHYNKTRSEYYRQLILTSRSEPTTLIPFINYALQGFVDGLREQLREVRHHQMLVAWENYVHAKFRDTPNTATQERRRHLVLDMPTDGTVVPRSAIRALSPRITEAFAGRQSKTINRDLNAVVLLGLMKRTAGGYVTEFDQLKAFLPHRFNT